MASSETSEIHRYLQGSFTLWVVLIVALCVATTLCSSSAIAETVTYKKSWLKLIDTGLEDGDSHISPREAGKWLDDHRLLARVSAQDELLGPRVRYRGRTVLYDLASRKTVDIMQYASPICWDPVSGKGALAVNDDPYDTSNKKQTVVGIRIDSDGRLIEQVAGVSGGSRGADCDVRRKYPTNERVQWPLHPEHGIFDAGKRGKRDNEQALLVKADGTTVKLPILGGKVDDVRYLPFSYQYQLGRGSDCLLVGEPCPPDIRLMSSAGEITTVKIPAELLQSFFISSVYVVRDGLLFPARKAGKKEGYLLLRDNILYHLWEPNSAGLFSSKQPELWGNETISPDGCKVAFTRGQRPSRIFVFDHCAVGK